MHEQDCPDIYDEKRRKNHHHLCWDCGKILPLGNKGRYCYKCLKTRKRRYGMNEKDYDPEKAAAAQTKFCDLNELPCFAPRDGYCWHCGENIYEVGRITIQKAGKTLITSCPCCNYSFVE